MAQQPTRQNEQLKQQTMPIDPPPDVTVSPAAGRQQRASPRTAAPHDEARQPARSGVVVKGRDGEDLSRSVDISGDPFYVPPSLIPPGWRYQWNVVSVNGSADVVRRHNLTMYSQGWRAVPSKRHSGVWTPHGYDGDIVVEGQRLEERPEELCQEAENADYAKAFAQMKDRDESLMGGRANLRGSSRDGIEVNPRRAKQMGLKPRLSIDPAYDIPAPAGYQPPDDSLP